MQSDIPTLIVTTGGTIGALAYYDFAYAKEFISTMPPDGEDFVRDAIRTMNLESVRCVSHEPRDSKLMDEVYRRNLLDLVEEAPETHVLITHGTDTLLETAEYIFQRAATHAVLANKTIILTGSMIPLANGPDSDGYLNLKFSLEQLERLGAGGHNGGVCIVLCDYENSGDESGPWLPRLYRYAPGRYEKHYCADRRYSRLRSI